MTGGRDPGTGNGGDIRVCVGVCERGGGRGEVTATLRFPTVAQRHAKEQGKRRGAARGEERRNARRVCGDTKIEATTRRDSLNTPVTKRDGG